MSNQLETEVLIVGAGSTGMSIARELSKYKVDVTVVDKNIEVSFGEVRSSLGFIYSSYGLANANSLILKSAATPDIPISEVFDRDSLKTKLTREGFDAFPALTDELDVEFKIYRNIIVAETEDEIKQLQVIEEICHSMGIDDIEHLDQDGIQAYEPRINKVFTRGISRYGDQGQIYPWEYTIALAENARDNGVRIMLLTEVRGITPLNGGFVVDTTSGPIKTRFIINAAGLYTDKIAEMAGVRDFDLFSVGALFYITDKRINDMVKTIAQLPSTPGVAIVLKPTLSGNIHILCTGFIECTEDGGVPFDTEIIKNDIATAQRLFPEFTGGDIINFFTGVSAFNTREPEEHLLEVSKGNPNFLNAVVRMPAMGFTPAMSKYMVGLLGNQGLALVKKPDFNPYRKRIRRVSTLPDKERQELIAKDPRYGHIVCRCEEVSEGEIIEAIRRGARTVAGVKYRTRAGMGRCQRGFCGPRVVEILARELDIPMKEVTMKGGLSKVITYRSKELLGAKV